MAISFTTLDSNDTDAPLAALVSWLASDLEVALGRLSSLIEHRSFGPARHELAVVRQMVSDLVELQIEPGLPRHVGAFDLAYDDSCLDTATS
jgi:hypothetical protein